MMPLSPVKLNLFFFDEHAFGSWLVHLNSIFMKQNHMLSYFLRFFFQRFLLSSVPILKIRTSIWRRSAFGSVRCWYLFSLAWSRSSNSLALVFLFINQNGVWDSVSNIFQQHARPDNYRVVFSVPKCMRAFYEGYPAWQVLVSSGVLIGHFRVASTDLLQSEAKCETIVKMIFSLMQIKLIFTEMFGTLPRFKIESFTSLRNCRDKLASTPSTSIPPAT